MSDMYFKLAATPNNDLLVFSSVQFILIDYLAEESHGVQPVVCVFIAAAWRSEEPPCQITSHTLHANPCKEVWRAKEIFE